MRTKQQDERIREIAERTFPDKGSSLADLCAEAIRAALADPVLVPQFVVFREGIWRLLLSNMLPEYMEPLKPKEPT